MPFCDRTVIDSIFYSIADRLIKSSTNQKDAKVISFKIRDINLVSEAFDGDGCT